MFVPSFERLEARRSDLAPEFLHRLDESAHLPRQLAHLLIDRWIRAGQTTVVSAELENFGIVLKSVDQIGYLASERRPLVVLESDSAQQTTIATYAEATRSIDSTPRRQRALSSSRTACSRPDRGDRRKRKRKHRGANRDRQRERDRNPLDVIIVRPATAAFASPSSRRRACDPSRTPEPCRTAYERDASG